MPFQGDEDSGCFLSASGIHFSTRCIQPLVDREMGYTELPSDFLRCQMVPHKAQALFLTLGQQINKRLIHLRISVEARHDLSFGSNHLYF